MAYKRYNYAMTIIMDAATSFSTPQHPSFVDEAPIKIWNAETEPPPPSILGTDPSGIVSVKGIGSRVHGVFYFPGLTSAINFSQSTFTIIWGRGRTDNTPDGVTCFWYEPDFSPGVTDQDYIGQASAGPCKIYPGVYVLELWQHYDLIGPLHYYFNAARFLVTVKKGTCDGGGDDGGPPPPPPPPQAYAAIELDGPRRVYYVGREKSISVYGSPDMNYLSSSKAYPIDWWVRLRYDARKAGRLAMLSKKDNTYQIWVSDDMGETATGGMTQMATSSVIERDGERGGLLWFYTPTAANSGTTDGAVYLRRSSDFGQTWDDPVAVKKSDSGGKPLVTTLYDSAQESRAAGQIVLLTSTGIWRSSDYGDVFELLAT